MINKRNTKRTDILGLPEILEKYGVKRDANYMNLCNALYRWRKEWNLEEKKKSTELPCKIATEG